MNSNPQPENIASLNIPSRNEVKNLIKARGIPVIRLAKHMGVPRHYLDYNLEGDQRMKPEVYMKIRKAIDEINRIDKNLFFSEAAEPQAPPKDPAASGASVPELPALEEYGIKIFPVLKKFSLVNGHPDISPENVSGLAFFKYPYFLNCFCCENYGDFMTDRSSVQSLNDGDYLLADLTQKILSGDVVIARITGDRDIVRQIIFGPENKITLKCFNPRYPDIVLDKNEIQYMAKVCYKHSKEIPL